MSKRTAKKTLIRTLKKQMMHKPLLNMENTNKNKISNKFVAYSNFYNLAMSD